MPQPRGSFLARAAYRIDSKLIDFERDARSLDKHSLWIGIALAIGGTAIVLLDARHPDRPFVDHPWLEAFNRLCLKSIRVPLADALTVLGLVFAVSGLLSIGLRRVNRIGSTKS